MRNKCAELMHMADDAAVTLRNEYAIQLLKLPKKVYSCSCRIWNQCMAESSYRGPFCLS